MSVDQLRAAVEFRDRVVAEIALRFPRYSAELTDDGRRSAGVYFRAPEPDGVDIELIASADWSYTLFVGPQIWVDGLPFEETKDDRIARVVSEIVEGITEPAIPEVLPREQVARAAGAVLSCIIGLALLAHLVALLALLRVVATQDLPKDSDQYSGVIRGSEVVLYGELARAGLILLLPLAGLLIFLGVWAIRRGGPARQQIIGVFSILVAALTLFATPFAGSLLAGYGW